MTEILLDDTLDMFESLRPKMVRIAYRMVGSIADAEDIVQETFLRWLRTERATVQEPEAFLRRIVTRLCLDHLKSARNQRETYIGPWLPEPVVEPAEGDVDDFTLPLMMVLERLSPLERAAFVLHDVFGLSFAEIAATIGREPATCRQLAGRARKNVRGVRPRFPVSRQRGIEIAAAFFRATRSGDMVALRNLLAEDVVVYADGGGKIATTRESVRGVEAVLRLHASLVRIFEKTMSRIIRYCFINGLPGFVTVEEEETLQTTAIQIEADRVVAVYVTRNPEKTRRLGEALVQ